MVKTEEAPMDAREFNKLVKALPIVQKQIGVKADGTPLYVEVHTLATAHAA